VDEPLEAATLQQHRAVVVADTSRRLEVRGYGVLGGQPSLAVPSMHAKVRAQCAGLGVGWLPRERAAGLLAHGELVEKRVANPREPNLPYVAWRGDHQGKALDWWLAQLKQERLAARLVKGIAIS